jgi:hypothetical protein
MAALNRILILVLACLFLPGCEKKAPPSKFLVPPNYEGAVITVYEQPGFPALPMEDGFLVHRYPDDGILFTSSKQLFGASSVMDQALEVMPDGSRRPLSGDRHLYGQTSGDHTGGGLHVSYETSGIGSDAYSRTHDHREFEKLQDEAVRRVEASRKAK